MVKNLYVIAGPNGVGKTAFAREFLPHFFASYASLADTCVIYDNAGREPSKVAYWQDGRFYRLQEKTLQAILKQVNRDESSL